MTASEYYVRNILGLALIVSTVCAALSIILDILSGLAFLSHEEVIASLFFHESFYLYLFFIPPYFIAKYINRPELIAAVKEFELMKSRSEQY